MIHLHLITRVENQAATIQEIIARLNVVFGAFHIRKHDRGVLTKIACDRSSGELISTCT